MSSNVNQQDIRSTSGVTRAISAPGPSLVLLILTALFSLKRWWRLLLRTGVDRAAAEAETLTEARPNVATAAAVSQVSLPRAKRGRGAAAGHRFGSPHARSGLHPSGQVSPLGQTKPPGGG